MCGCYVPRDHEDASTDKRPKEHKPYDDGCHLLMRPNIVGDRRADEPLAKLKA